MELASEHYTNHTTISRAFPHHTSVAGASAEERPNGRTGPRRLLESALPLLAIVLMTSGIVIRTVPLESKRPADLEQAKFSHAGVQDVEARLWEDPFGAIRHLEGRTPGARCEEALKDKGHYPYALSKHITHVSERSGFEVTVLPVLIQGGPYSEHGESRRRARYAVVTALLNTGWEPSDEDKMGYVWTFENCVDAPWARRVPELLPYEWFAEDPGQRSARSDASTPQRSRRLLILWVDEDAVARAPLKGIEQLRELLGRPETLCSPGTSGERKRDQWLARLRLELADRLNDHNACFDFKRQPSPQHPILRSASFSSGANEVLTRFVNRQESSPDTMAQTRAPSLPDSQLRLPWRDMHVIGPSTTTALQGMVRELARSLVDDTKSSQPDGRPPPPRFYSSTATADLGKEFSRALERAKSSRPGADSNASAQVTSGENKKGEHRIKELKERFDRRIVQLTTTDEGLARALGEELSSRLGDQTPWQRLVAWLKGRSVLCGNTIVIVGEGDTPYARFFRQELLTKLTEFFEGCGGDDTVEQVSYLRGLDGIMPTGTGGPASSEPQEPASRGMGTRAGMIGNILPDQATLERADGRSQYDYLRRLGEHLIALDRRKRQEGGHGVTAIGVFGNDTYDKLLVLDALREYFPRAVFFAADLDARLLGREALRSTRNLVVASAYGLKLHRRLQGTAPPFRDTYQTGIYLATRVALDSVAQELATGAFKCRFDTPRLFEIGRTQAVPLWQVNQANMGPCKELTLGQFWNIHPDDEWRGFDPLPEPWVGGAVAVMVLTAASLALLFSDRAYGAVRDAGGWLSDKPSRWGVLAGALLLALGLLMAGLWVITVDVATPTGEPFAWLEGVSIWPTQILQMLLLALTGALLVGGRVWLRRKIDRVANTFHVKTLTERENTSSPILSSTIWTRVMWLWDLGGCPQTATVEGGCATDPWEKFLSHMRRKPSATRIVCTTVLLFLFSLALLSLDWPSSPHRGLLSAWFNHVLQLLLLAAMTALLASALDTSMMATRLLRACLDQYCAVPRRSELVRQALEQRDPAVDHVQRAAEITSAVNRLIYLPFLTFLLLVPTRSRVFDAWVLPLPYVVLILLAIGVALLHTIALRREAAGRRAEVLADVDQKAARYELQAKLGQDDVPDARDMGSDPAASATADLLRSRADRLRGVRDGHFRPLDQEPVVRALLLLLGGTGTLTIIEFLFLGQS